MRNKWVKLAMVVEKKQAFTVLHAMKTFSRLACYSHFHVSSLERVVMEG